MSCLVFKDKVGRRIEVAIDKPRIAVGRQPGNDVVIPFRSVSRQHCEFLVKPEGVHVRDIGSSNGSMVNGQPLQGEVLLKDRDQLQIGEFRIRFYESSKYPSNSLSMDKTQSVVLFEQDVARKAGPAESDSTGAVPAPPPPTGGGRTIAAFVGGALVGAMGTAALVVALLVIGILKLGTSPTP